MSVNCIKCVKNRRTGLDLLCDQCRNEEWAGKLAICNAIDELRKEEGASVLICCSNPEGNGPDNEAVEVIDDWTHWQPERFEGSTLRVALENAVHEKKLRVSK